MSQSEATVLGFEVNYFDALSSKSTKLWLSFRLEDETIELHDDERVFLKRIAYPGIKAANLVIGSSINM